MAWLRRSRRDPSGGIEIPLNPLGLDWSNDLTRDLVVAWHAAARMDLALPSRVWTLGSVYGLSDTAVGLGMESTTTGDNTKSARTGTGSTIVTSTGDGTGAFTLACWANPISEDNWTVGVNQREQGVPFSQTGVGFNVNAAFENDANSVLFNTYDDAPGVELDYDSAAAIDGDMHLYVGTRAANGNMRLYIDGAQVASNSSTLKDDITSSSGEFKIAGLGDYTGDSYEANCTIPAAMGWDRALTASEVADLFEPATRWKWIAVPPTRAYFIPGAVGGDTFNKSATDSFAFSDTPAETAVFERVVADALALSDTPTESATFVRTLADSLVLSDATAGSTGILVSVVESLVFADTVTESAAFARAVADALGLTDTATETGVLLRAVIDALTFTDVTTAEGGEEVPAAEAHAGGSSMTLRQMRRLERSQLLAMIREDDAVIASLVASYLRRSKRLN